MSKHTPAESDALIVVDVQRDFCPGGSMGVNEGDKVVPVINGLLPKFNVKVFTRDWHPPDHFSFSDEPKFVDKSWPPHCVAGTEGAMFHPGLKVPGDALVVNKGTDKNKEAYSGFDGTRLAADLKKLGIKRVFVCGIATDYCVKATVLGAIREGFAAALVADAVKGVDVPPGNAEKAVNEMGKAGAEIVVSGDIG